MENLRAWSACMCFAAVGCCAVELLAPKDKTGKIFRLLVMTFFLCSMVTPCLKMIHNVSLDIDFLPQEIVSERLEEKVTEQLVRQVEVTVKQLTEECLSYRDVKAREICVETDISTNGSICIQQVVIRVDKQNVSAALAARDALRTQLGAPVIVESTG